VRMGSRFLRAADGTNEWVGRSIGFVILPIVAIVVIEVISRYVFDHPTIFAHEMTLFLFGPYIMLAGGYALLHNAHVNVDVIYVRFPVRVRALAALITALLFFFYAGLLLWQGGEMAWDSVVAREVNPTFWAPIIYPIKIVIPIAAFLLLMQGLAKFVRDLHVLRSGEKGSTEAR